MKELFWEKDLASYEQSDIEKSTSNIFLCVPPTSSVQSQGLPISTRIKSEVYIVLCKILSHTLYHLILMNE